MYLKTNAYGLLLTAALLVSACAATAKQGGTVHDDTATAADDVADDAVAGDAASSGDGLGNDTVGNGSGQLDGVWKLVSCTCDGAAKNVGSGATYGFTGNSGVITSPIDGTCTMLIPTSVTYPSAGTVEWTVLTATCQPTACYSACGQVFNMKHTATYTVNGQSLTITEAKTPVGEYDCSEKAQICQLTKM